MRIRKLVNFSLDSVVEVSRTIRSMLVSVRHGIHSNDTHREHPLGDLLGTRVMGWLTVKL